MRDADRPRRHALLLEDFGSLRSLQRLEDYSASMVAMSRVTADVVHDVKKPRYFAGLLPPKRYR